MQKYFSFVRVKQCPAINLGDIFMLTIKMSLLKFYIFLGSNLHYNRCKGGSRLDG